MSAQPLLFTHERDPKAPPLVVRLAVDCRGFVCEAGGKTAEQFDRLYPSCAPHYVTEFVEHVTQD